MGIEMLRVLTLSTLFPDADRPTFGIFVERQTRGLAARDDVAVEVVAPVPLPPGPLARVAHYRKRAALPLHEVRNGLSVHRPRCLHFPRIGARFQPALMAHALLPFLRELRERFPFDVIDAEFFWPDGPAAVRLGEALGVPVSIKARGADIQMWGQTGFGGRQLRTAGAGAAGMLAVSAALKRDMTALGLPGERIRVHYTGVDLDAFAPADRAEAKARLGITGPLLLTVGYLIPRKGQDLVIAALEDIPGATLLIVGEGPMRASLEAQVAARHLGDRVRMLGPRRHAELPALFAAADATVLPSSSEGLANVWVESLACGTPLVITDVGGARELVDRPAAGHIVERNPQAIAAGVRGLLANPPARAETRAAADRFTWHANTDALVAHLNGIVGR